MARQYIKTNQSKKQRDAARCKAIADITKCVGRKNNRNNMMEITSQHIMSNPKTFFSECLNTIIEYSITNDNRIIKK